MPGRVRRSSDAPPRARAGLCVSDAASCAGASDGKDTFGQCIVASSVGADEAETHRRVPFVHLTWDARHLGSRGGENMYRLMQVGRYGTGLEFIGNTLTQDNPRSSRPPHTVYGVSETFTTRPGFPRECSTTSCLAP